MHYYAANVTMGAVIGDTRGRRFLLHFTNPRPQGVNDHAEVDIIVDRTNTSPTTSIRRVLIIPAEKTKMCVKNGQKLMDRGQVLLVNFFIL